MKILSAGDLHITSGRPEHRIDDFQKSQDFKIRWILSAAKNLNCDVIVFPGDVTDNPKLPYKLTRHYIELFKNTGIPIIAVYGQHDLRYHATKNNTPLATMQAAGVISIAGADPIRLKQEQLSLHEVHFYGASWDEEIPKLKERSKTTNVLITHQMVIDDTKIWEGQDNYISSENLLRLHPQFDIILTGDNHQTFFNRMDKRLLFNTGSLMRSTIAQVKHQPRVFVIDTDTMVFETYNIPIKNINEVMDIEEALKDKKRDDKVRVWIEKLTKEFDSSDLDFPKNLNLHIQKNTFEQEVLSLLEEATGLQYLSKEA